jgi:hypothetical protein
MHLIAIFLLELLVGLGGTLPDCADHFEDFVVVLEAGSGVGGVEALQASGNIGDGTGGLGEKALIERLLGS